MVVVQCFHCNAVLELDDGFRGGVCRCSGCGSLLQVPRGEQEGATPGKRRKRPAGPPGPTAPIDGATERAVEADGNAPAAVQPPPTDIPTDAGTSSSTLRRIQQARPVEPVPLRTASGNGNLAAAREGIALQAVVPVLPPRRNRITTALAIFLFLVLLGLIILMAWLFLHNSKSDDNALGTSRVPTTGSALVLACLPAANR